ncbi:MAG TPA: hypothetical protein VHF25_06590 [Nitriliruptorales bacterium]|nr:hypothetical protein [Nitriliruptorales bacterium]
MRTRHAEAGGIVTGWLGQLVVIMAVLAFLGYEAIATALNAISVQDTAQEAARVAAGAYRDAGGDEGHARAAAEAEATEREAAMTAFDINAGTVTVTVRQQADTLVIDAVSLFDDLTTRTATGRRELPP